LNFGKVGQVAQEVNLNFDNALQKAVIMVEDLGPNPWLTTSSYVDEVSLKLGLGYSINMPLTFFKRVINATKFFFAFDEDSLLGSISSLVKVDDWYLVNMWTRRYCLPTPGAVAKCGQQARTKQANLDGILLNDFYYNLTYTSDAYS
jgi:hypothetical protein